MNDGPSEPVKAGAHLIALCVCSVLCAHNVAAWLTRPNAENGINALVYAVGCAFEWSRAMRHFNQPASVERGLPRSVWAGEA